MISTKQQKTKYTSQIIDMDSLVPENHLVRKMEELIDFEFIRDEVKHLYSQDKGRPSIDPVVLFKILFIQYMFGIKSMRQTIREIEVNIAYRWFIGYDFYEKIPNYSTFSKNYERRFVNTDIFEKIFLNILNQINNQGLINKESIFIDSTHTKAYANKRKIEEVYVEESYNKYVDALHQEINEIRKEEGKKPLVTKKVKKIISKTDKECGMFHKGEKERQLAYSTQVACDEQGWIIAQDCYPGNMNDNNTGIQFIEPLLEDNEINNIVMDAGYTGNVLINEIIKQSKLPIVPYTRPKGKKTDKFRKNDYQYHQDLDYYICPNQKYLTYRGLDSQGFKIYKSKTKDCKNCPFKHLCTNQSTKTITRHLLEHTNDIIREIRLSELGKELYPKRKTTIERCFAITKFNHNLGFTFLRGLKKNKDRNFVIFAMYNLKKLANIIFKDTIASLLNCFNFRFSY